MTFYVAETNANDFVNNQALWVEVKAGSLSAAKRAASYNRMFQRTAAWVGTKGADGNITPIAVKRCDAISGAPYAWADL